MMLHAPRGLVKKMIILGGIFFLFLYKTSCGNPLEMPWRGASNEYLFHNVFLWRNEKKYPRIIFNA